jgi:hypothetical protein
VRCLGWSRRKAAGQGRDRGWQTQMRRVTSRGCLWIWRRVGSGRVAGRLGAWTAKARLFVRRVSAGAVLAAGVGGGQDKGTRVVECAGPASAFWRRCFHLPFGAACTYSLAVSQSDDWTSRWNPVSEISSSSRLTGCLMAALDADCIDKDATELTCPSYAMGYLVGGSSPEQ